MNKKSLFDILKKKTLFFFYLFLTFFVTANIVYTYLEYKDQYHKAANKYLEEEKSNLIKQVNYAANLLNLQNRRISVLAHKLIEMKTVSIAEILRAKKGFNKNDIIKIFDDFEKGKDNFNRHLFLLDRRTLRLIYFSGDKLLKRNFAVSVDTNKFRIRKVLNNKSKEGFTELPLKIPGKLYPDFVLCYLKPINKNFIIGTEISVESFTEKIKGIVSDFLNGYRFGKNNYIFIIRLFNINGGKKFGKMFINPNRPDLVGKFISDDYKDVKGKEFRKEFLKVLREKGSGFVSYWYKKPSTGLPSPKLSYWKLSDDGRFIIAAGFYLDDYKEEVAFIKEGFYNKMYNFVLLSLLLLIAITITYYYVNKKVISGLDKDFSLLSLFFKTAVKENKPIDTGKINFSELLPLAEDANQMLGEKIEFENLLREEKNRLFVTMQSIGDGLITTDNEGKVTFLNAVAEKLTGWNNNEAVGKHIEEIFNIVNEKTGEKVGNPVERVLKNGKIVGLANHTLLISKDGSMYNIADSAAPIVSAGNKIIGVVFIFRDITKEYKLNEQLKKAKETNEAIINALPDLIFVFNANYEFVNYYSSNTETLLFPPEEFLGKKVSDVLPPDLAFTTESSIRKVFSTKQIVTFEYSVEINGSTKFFEARLAYKGDNEVMSVVRDITEKKSALIALKESEEKFKNLSLIKKAILESPTGIIIFALDNEYRYIDFTLQHKLMMKTAFGADIEVGNCILDYMKNEEYKLKAKENFDKALKGESFVVIEEYRNEKIKPNYYENRISPVFNDEGEIIGVSVYVIDITERMRAQNLVQETLREVEEKAEELQRLNDELIKLNKEIEIAKEKAEASDRLKTEFLAQISHEIRSPLNVIVNFTSLIKSELEDVENENINEAFVSINSASRRIIRTIELIINVSELQLGTYHSKKYKFDLIYAINAIYSEFEHSAELKGLDLQFESDFDELEIYTDEYALTQMIVNLVDNAVKYTNEGFVKISVRKEGKKIFIVVSDSGIGISKEFLPHLFEEFRQEEQGYHRRFEGSGLGMALIKKYAETIGAEIKVESEKGKGSTFTIILEDETSEG